MLPISSTEVEYNGGPFVGLQILIEFQISSMGITPEEFQAQVLDVSHHTPILVDFWAPWCGPCRVLGPILDKLAAESDGQWQLFKVNTDESQQVAQSYQIRSIPAVKLFVDGAATAEFMGAQAEHMIRHWLHEHLPTPSRTALEEALTLLGSGHADEAAAILRPALAEDPANENLRIRLAQALALSDIDEANQLAQNTPADPELAMVATAIQTVANFATRDPALLPDGKGRKNFEGAIQEISSKNYEMVIARLMLVLQHDRNYFDDAARKLGVALFALLGPGHPLTQQHRRTFDMWLY